jgi:dGTPase
LAALDPWPKAAYDGSRHHLAGLKNLTSRLINRFCSAVQAGVAVADLPQPSIRYAGDIPVPDEVRTEIAVLKGVAAQLVMKADDRVAVLTRQRELLGELVEATWKGAPESFEPVFQGDFAAAADDASRRRVVIDQVASLTDLSAVDRHRALTSRA